MSHSAAYLETLHIMGAYVCAFIENWQSSSVKFTQREEILPQETANHYQLAKPKQTNESKPEMNCKRHWGKAAPLYDYLILCEQCVCTLTETSSSPPDARQHRFKLNIIEHLCQTGAVLFDHNMDAPENGFISWHRGCFSTYSLL